MSSTATSRISLRKSVWTGKRIFTTACAGIIWVRRNTRNISQSIWRALWYAWPTRWWEYESWSEAYEHYREFVAPGIQPEGSELLKWRTAAAVCGMTVRSWYAASRSTNVRMPDLFRGVQSVWERMREVERRIQKYVKAVPPLCGRHEPVDVRCGSIKMIEWSKYRVYGPRLSGGQLRLATAADVRVLSVVAPVVLLSFAALEPFRFFRSFRFFLALRSFFVTLASLALLVAILIVHFVVFHSLSLPNFIVLSNIFNMSGK